VEEGGGCGGNGGHGWRGEVGCGESVDLGRMAKGKSRWPDIVTGKDEQEV